MKEYVIWGIPAGETSETLLIAKWEGRYLTNLILVKELASMLITEKGCGGVRVQVIDGSIPDFAGTINI